MVGGINEYLGLGHHLGQFNINLTLSFELMANQLEAIYRLSIDLVIFFLLINMV